MKCETCIKRKTPYCPPSMECMATDDMPYYQNRITLLEENQTLNGAIQTYEILLKTNVEENKRLKDNWNKLKEWVNKHYDYYMNEEDYIGGKLCFGDMKTKMQELERRNSDESN